MFTQSFSVAGSSLELLNTGERGIVTKFRSTDETIIEKLMAMGLTPGVTITLEQRFPSFVIKVGNARITLDRRIARAIYVRIGDR
ncbi:MAG TPA: FeoA family protein [Allocoleopsis sp.]